MPKACRLLDFPSNTLDMSRLRLSIAFGGDDFKVMQSR